MTAPMYEIRDASKRFGGVLALDGLDFHLGAGEVVGLLGDNGAGKSTLIKMMSGIVPPDAGQVFVDGAEVQVRSRRDSQKIGIETIYQDTALVDSMSIVRNIFMGRELVGKRGFLDHRRMREVAVDVLRTSVHISGIDDPDKEVGALSGGQKQAVAIARAVYFKRRILLLDEPTSALSVRETENLLGYIKRLRDEGGLERAGHAQSLSRLPSLRPVRGDEPRTQGVRRGQGRHVDRRAHPPRRPDLSFSRMRRRAAR